MSLSMFLKKNSFSKEDWTTISNTFGIGETFEYKTEYMNKDYFFVKLGEANYVPKVRPTKEKENILYEHKVIDFVNKNVVKAGQPIDTINGNRLFEINNKIVCFYEKIEGRHYDNFDEELFEAVNVIAKLHSVGKDFKEKKEAYFFNGNFESLQNLNTLNNNIINKALKRIQKKEVPWDNLDESLTHGDMHPGNVVFENGQVIGLLDLEVANVGSTATDLSWMLRTFTSKKGWQQTGAFDLGRLEEAKLKYEEQYKTDFEYLPELLLGHYLSHINDLISQKREIQEDVIQVKWILKNYE